MHADKTVLYANEKRSKFTTAASNQTSSKIESYATNPIRASNVKTDTIIIYKFPLKSRKEIEQMLGLSELKKTKVYQEAKLEGKLEAVPFMLSLGTTVEQIAEALKLDIESVRQVAESTKTIQEKSSQSDTAE